MNDYHKFILELSDEVRAYRRRHKIIKHIKENAWDIIKSVIIAIVGAIILALFQ